MNIYVGNLNYTLSEDDLKDVFENFGDVNSVRIIKDKATGRSKGFAFVDMVNDSEANKAISELNGSDLKGRNMKVNLAKEQK